MNDLRAKILSKMTKPALASLATVTADGRPWTRYVVVKADEEMNIWIATFKGSRKTEQIAGNPEVHLVLGVEDMQRAASWLQIEGKAAILDDQDTKQAVWYDMLEAIFKGPDDPNYVVCQVKPYRIEYYTMNRADHEVWEA